MNLCRVGAQFISIPIMARLLGPYPFGLMAIAMPVISIAALVAELGLSGILVREHDVMTENTGFWMGIIASTGLLVPLLMITVVITQFIHPEIWPVILALSVMLIMTALLAVPVARLTREGKLASIAMGDGIGVLGGLIVAIYGALHGWGVYSLVGQQIAILLGRLSIFAIEARFVPKFIFDPARAKYLARACISMTGSNLFAVGSKTLDNFLMGALLGARPAGSYAMSYQLVRVPDMLLSGPLYMAVTSAAAQSSQSEQPQQPKALYALTSQALALVALPAMVGMALVADPLVDVLLGEQWRSAAPVLASLAGAGLFQALNVLNMAFLTGFGEYRQQLRIGWLTLAATIAGVALGSHWQTIGVGWGVTVASLAGFVAGTSAVAKRLEISLPKALMGLWISIPPTVAMTVAVILAQYALPPQTQPWFMLPIPIAAGMLTYYLALMATAQKKLLLQLASLKRAKGAAELSTAMEQAG